MLGWRGEEILDLRAGSRPAEGGESLLAAGRQAPVQAPAGGKLQPKPSGPAPGHRHWFSDSIAGHTPEHSTHGCGVRMQERLCHPRPQARGQQPASEARAQQARRPAPRASKLPGQMHWWQAGTWYLSLNPKP